jgi:four helix bundle protein
MDFAHSIYGLTLSFFSQYRELARQLQNSVLSIPLNIAEGSGRKSKADFRRLLAIGNGSINESVTSLQFAKGVRQVNEDEYVFHYSWATKIAKMLNGLYNSLG